MLETVVRNWPLKIVAVLLAAAIWVAVTGENRIVRDFRVPVDVALPEDLVPAEAPPSTVGVRLRGPETLFRRLDTLPLEVEVDLTDAEPGARNVQLVSADVAGLPKGVEVESLDPDRFRIVLEKRARKVLPVVASFAGQPPRGFAVYDVRIVPEALEVEGPESSVAALTRLRTDPIHLEDKTAPFTIAVTAVPTRLEVRVVDPIPLEAQVEVDRAPETRTLRAVPVVVTGPGSPADASMRAVAVVVAAPPDVLRRLDARQARAVADSAGLAPRAEPYAVPVRVEFPGITAHDAARIAVRSIDRPRISVRVGAARAGR
jgi:YbbR domain-containing protein